MWATWSLLLSSAAVFDSIQPKNEHLTERFKKVKETQNKTKQFRNSIKPKDEKGKRDPKTKQAKSKQKILGTSSNQTM